MIAVIILFQLVDYLLFRYVSSSGKLLNIFRHLHQKFFFGDATDTSIVIIHGYVGDVVQFAEDADLRELGDACQEDKAQFCFAVFQRTEEVAHDIA